MTEKLNRYYSERNKRLFLAGVLSIIIIGLLAVYTDNPDKGTPNDNLSQDECKSIGFYAPECPPDQNQNQSNASENTRNLSRTNNYSET